MFLLLLKSQELLESWGYYTAFSELELNVSLGVCMILGMSNTFYFLKMSVLKLGRLLLTYSVYSHWGWFKC